MSPGVGVEGIEGVGDALLGGNPIDEGQMTEHEGRGHWSAPPHAAQGEEFVREVRVRELLIEGDGLGTRAEQAAEPDENSLPQGCQHQRLRSVSGCR